MAVPKGKVSRQRRDKRRSSHWKLTAPSLVKCPNCGGTLEEIMPAKDRHVLPMYACTCCNR